MKTLKRLLKTLVCLLSLAPLSARAELLWSETFDYSNGAIENVSSVWTQYNNLPDGQTPSLEVVDGRLKLSPYTGGDGGGDAKRDLGRMFGSGESIYYAFELTVNSLGEEPGSGLITGFRQPTSLGGTVFVVPPASGGDFRLGLAPDDFEKPADGAITADDLSFGTTYRVVVQLRLTIIGSTTKLWINPVDASTEPVLTASGTDPRNYEQFGIYQVGNSRSIDLIIDNLLVGTTFDAVSPRSTWTKVDDFETGADQIPVYYSTLATLGAPLPGQINGPLPDFMDETNTVLAISPGTDGETWNNLAALIQLPEPIPHGSIGTIYFRFATYGPDLNVALGPSFENVRTLDGEEEDGLPFPRAWNDFATYAVVTNQAEPANQIAVHDGSGTPGNRKSPSFQYEPGIWYHVWIVVNNSDKVSEWFVQGPDNAVPIRLKIPIYDGTNPTEELRDFTYFRNNQRGEVPVVSFMFLATNLSDVHQGDFFLVDDMYVDVNSANLTIPVGGSSSALYGGYPIVDVDGHRWINSNELGFLYINHSPMLYSATIGKYIYMPEDFFRATGAWGFIMNNHILSNAPGTHGGYTINTTNGTNWIDSAELGVSVLLTDLFLYSYLLDRVVYSPSDLFTEAGAWAFIYK